MLLRNRPAGIDSRPAPASQGLEHLPASSIAVLAWLHANRVDFVLVGPVARAIRGDTAAQGPIDIVAAPYGRNLDRLGRALVSARAQIRPGRGVGVEASLPAKLSAEHLLRAERWTLRCGTHDLDIEGHPPNGPRYQELLYESIRFEVAPDVAVEVAAPEDIEYYDHLRRTGTAPEIRVSRGVRDAEAG
jgi:hypothetical protein